MWGGGGEGERRSPPARSKSVCEDAGWCVWEGAHLHRPQQRCGLSGARDGWKVELRGGREERKISLRVCSARWRGGAAARRRGGASCGRDEALRGSPCLTPACLPKGLYSAKARQREQR